MNAWGEKVINIDIWFETGITETGFLPPPLPLKKIKNKKNKGEVNTRKSRTYPEVKSRYEYKQSNYQALLDFGVSDIFNESLDCFQVQEL